MFYGPLIALVNPSKFFGGTGETELNLGITLFIARNLAIGLAFLFAIYIKNGPMLFILILVRLITDLIDAPAFQIFREPPFGSSNDNFYVAVLSTSLLWIAFKPLERNKE